MDGTATSGAGKRDAILRSALHAFAERGVNGVAVPQIATLAGVGVGTIYRYFPTKETLVNELYREEKSRLLERVFGGLDGADPHALFTEFWRRLAAFAREQPDAYRFLELQDHRPYLEPASRDLERRSLAPVLRGVARLQADGTFRADVRAELLMAMTWGAFVNLVKSERNGLIALSDADLAAAGEAAWRMCTPD